MQKRIDIILIFWILFVCFLCGVIGWYACSLFNSAREISSPGDHIKLENLFYDNETFCFKYHDLEVYAPIGTKSMDPVFDKGSFTVHYKPKSIDEIQVGDIVSYYNKIMEEEYNVSIMTHRVIDIKGNMIKTQGDNVKGPDQGWIPFSQIEGIVIAIIY